MTAILVSCLASGLLMAFLFFVVPVLDGRRPRR